MENKDNLEITCKQFIERGFVAKKKLNRLIVKHLRKMRKIHWLLTMNEKYQFQGRIKYFFAYSIWTRKTPEELTSNLESLQYLVKEIEEFIWTYSSRLQAWT